MKRAGQAAREAGSAGAQQKQRTLPVQGGTIKPNRPPTEYEVRVYKLCKAIPEGKVSTYGAMAAVLQSSARAVGQSMRRNPFAPDVPCHRVIAADLELGGFSGSWGLECANVQRKKQMLLQEGVKFNGNKVSSASVVQPDELQQLLKLQGPVDFKRSSNNNSSS